MLPWKRFLAPLLALLLLSPLACQDFKPTPNIRFGMPAPAAKEHEAYLIARKQYVLSYNGKAHNPNWVCWRLEKADIGKSVRGAFQADPLLPASIAKVAAGVYTGSGFDRGHMCAAQDRSGTQENMDSTFYTTNIVPQAPHNNQRGWEKLEAYSRDLTKDGHVLWICAGPAGQGGEGSEGRKEEIGTGRVKVVVPAKVWKTILVLPGEDAKPTKQSRTIAVIMPNDQSVDQDWSKFRVSVSEVEKLSGLRF